jgi:EmrB/QacA subfamily drug resistance transporter
MAGLGLFVFASLLCGVSQSQGLLVAARFVQGVAGAMTSAVVLGMIVTMFPEPREQAKAIGVYGFVASAGGSIGLLLGGVLTQTINWHWIFFVNVPIGIVTGFIAMRLIENDKGIGIREGADTPGAVLITSALMLGVFTIVKPAADYGWGSGRTLLFGAGSLLLLAAFVAREATAAKPLIPLRIFRSRNVTGANLIQMLLVAGMFGMFFLGSLYLQRVRGYDALQIGLAFLPTTLVMGVLSLRFSEPLIMRFGARRTLLPGLVFIGVGLALFARVPVNGSYVADVLPALIVVALGIGTSFPALMTLAMSGATQEDAGLASGLVNTSAQVGGALGLAVLATLSATRSDHLLSAGKSTAAALTGGYHLAFLIGAALVGAGLVLALTVLQPEQKAAAEAVEGEAAYSEAA